MYQLVTQAYAKKKIRLLLSRVEPITFRLQVRILYYWAIGDKGGAKAIKIVSWDKHPAYCYDLNIIFMNLVVGPLSLLIHVFAFV